MTTPPRPEFRLPKIDKDTADVLLWPALIIQVLLACGGAPGMAISVVWIVLEIFWYRETQSKELPLPARIAVGVGGLYLLVLLLSLLLGG